MGHLSVAGIGTKGEDHTQGLARTQLLSDGSIYWFLSYSDIGGAGRLSQYRYGGGVDGDHVVQTSPLTVAPMTQLLVLDGEPHPSDIAFLADVGGADAGYVFVTEEYDQHLVAVYCAGRRVPLCRAGPAERLGLHPGRGHVFLPLVGGPCKAAAELVRHRSGRITLRASWNDGPAPGLSPGPPAPGTTSGRGVAASKALLLANLVRQCR